MYLCKEGVHCQSYDQNQFTIGGQRRVTTQTTQRYSVSARYEVWSGAGRKVSKTSPGLISRWLCWLTDHWMVLINTYQFEWALHDDGIHCIQSCRTSYYYHGFIMILAYYIAPHSIHFCHKITHKATWKSTIEIELYPRWLNLHFSLLEVQ